MRRPNGQGSVFQRKDGRWLAQVTVYRDGRRHFLTRVRRTPEAARAAMRSLLTDAAATSRTRRETLDVYLAAWLDRTRPAISPRSAEKYGDIIRLHIAPLLGGLYVDALKPSDVARLIADCLDHGLAPVSTGQVVVVLAQALETAVADGVLERNVARLVRRPRAERRLVEPLRPADARRILTAVAHDPYEAFYVLLLASGLRAGEAAALDWRDVDLDAATVRVRAGKTPRARRVVPLPAMAVAALRAHRARSGVVDPLAPVFVRIRSGQRMTNSAAYSRFQGLLAAAGLPAMRLHDLRHGHATLAIASGMDMRYLADQLGHADPGMTSRIYAHVIPELQRGAVDRLGATLTNSATNRRRR